MTDEIDTDWGADQQSDWAAEQQDEVTQLAPAVHAPRSAPPPARHSSPPPRASVPPPPPRRSSVPPPPRSPSSPPRAESAAPAEPGLRQPRLRSQTLLGIAPPVLTPSVPAASSAEAVLEPTEPTAAPLPVDAASEADDASEGAPAAVRQAHVRSRTLIGLPTPTPSQDSPAPAPVAPGSTPLVGSVPPAAPERAPDQTLPMPSFAPQPAALASEPPPAARPSAPPPRASAPPDIPSAAVVSARIAAPVDVAPLRSPAAGGEPEASSGFGRWLMLLAVAVVVVAAIGYRVLRHSTTAPIAAAPSPAVPAERQPEPLKAEAPVAAVNAAAPALPDSATAAGPTPSAEPAPSAKPAASAEPPSAPVLAGSANAAAPTPTVEPPSAAAAPSSTADGPLISITLKSIPPKARFFHFGKEVGTAPFVLQLKPGEKHAYEAGLPGYITRKVLVDGTKPEITVGLRKEPR